MALITDPTVTSQLSQLANSGQIDTAQVIAILNSVLPTGQQISTATSGTTTGIYKQFGDFDMVNAKVEVVTTGLWSNGSGSLTTFFTSSAQTASVSAQYYTNVFNLNPQTNTTAEVQFAVAYGHVDGSGSVSLQVSDNALLATKSTYAQYKSMLLQPNDNLFSFQNSSNTTTDSNDIYVINIARSRYKESMDAGNWQLTLSGSNGVFYFIDDSGKKFSDTAGNPGNVFNVVSGGLNLGTQLDATISTATAANGLGYGLFYPDRGMIVLNPQAIGRTVGKVLIGNSLVELSGSLSTAAEQYNHMRLVSSINASVSGDFEARSTENVSTQHFFVRATNREFNYSNNPTYVDSNGNFTEPSFQTNPITYITTVGLLNDANELIAVAKTSQPIPKSFDAETLIKIKLSF